MQAKRNALYANLMKRKEKIADKVEEKEAQYSEKREAERAKQEAAEQRKIETEFRRFFYLNILIFINKFLDKNYWKNIKEKSWKKNFQN